MVVGIDPMIPSVSFAIRVGEGFRLQLETGDPAEPALLPLGREYFIDDWPDAWSDLTGRLYLERVGRGDLTIEIRFLERDGVDPYCILCPDDPCCSAIYDCNDGNACTSDYCQYGCQHGHMDCDDGNLCTDDACNSVMGCVHTWRCPSGDDHCLSVGCDPRTGNCVQQTVDCDDDNPCTVDFCLHDLGCQYERSCPADEDLCTTEGCDPFTGACTSEPVDCDDGNPCTDDACDPATGACLYEPHCTPDEDPCTTDWCDEGFCRHDPVDCDDPTSFFGNFTTSFLKT